MLKQIKDDSGEIVPLLSYKTRGASQLNYTTAAANSLVLTSKIVSITSTSTCFIELSANNLAANTSISHYIVSNIPYDLSIGAEKTNTYLSVIGSTNSGTLYISERI